MRSKPVGLLVVCLLVAAAVQAADCTQAGNLVSNCGFDTDLSGWVIGAADASAHIPDDGGFALGSAELDRHDGIGAVELIGSCMVVSPNTSYNLGVSYRLITGLFADTCLLIVNEWDDMGCSNFVDNPFFRFAPVPAWSERFDTHLTSASTNSVVLVLMCNEENNDFVIRVDDFLFGENLFSEVVFDDGFESGLTTNWSAESP